MAKIDGVKIFLKIGSNVLVGQTTGSMDLTSDMIDCTSKDSGQDKEYLAGERDATISVDSLYDPAAAEGFSEVFGYLKAGTSIAWSFGETEAATKVWNGNGFISQVTLNGPKNEASSYSLTIQNSGAVTEATNP